MQAQRSAASHGDWLRNRGELMFLSIGFVILAAMMGAYTYVSFQVGRKGGVVTTALLVAFSLLFSPWFWSVAVDPLYSQSNQMVALIMGAAWPMANILAALVGFYRRHLRLMEELDSE